jgi:TPR repeat protein
MLLDGSAPRRDATEARRYLQQAAERGMANASLLLSALCQRGQGAPADLVEAARWRLIATYQDQNSRLPAMREIAGLGAEQRRQARQQAMQWLQAHPTAKRPGYDETQAESSEMIRAAR